MDCPVGATAPACPGTSGAGPGGYTLGDMGKVIGSFQVHADGEIWSRDAVGPAPRARAPRRRAALVTGGLRLSPDNPSFLEMRDAIIQADQVLGGDALRRRCGQLFAARGMGFSAHTASADATSAIEAFDLPPVLAARRRDGHRPARPAATATASPSRARRCASSETLRNPWATRSAP